MMRDDAGSALIEALVAAAIVAGVLGAVFESLSAAQQRQAGLEQRRAALMIARSRLAAVGAEIATSPGETDGVQGDFSWRVRIDSGQTDASSASRAGPADLVTVSVRPLRQGADMVELKSLRFAAAAP
jgi:type II secretory pathway pseudopilin PulG